MTIKPQNIHIKFSGIDEASGAIFLQFATDETLHMIDQQVMHGFFPSEHNKAGDIEQLLPEMARFGQQMLMQQIQTQQNKFNPDQVSQVQQLMGKVKTVSVEADTAAGDMALSNVGSSQQYNIDSMQNANGNIDQMRNIVLEVLAEEGLIKGAVK
ncbi:MAG: hypothetical protein ACMZ63_06350 [Methylotenera sp.]